uniref:Transposase (Putative), gypsy type n=1 Tax=Tanacetum cinerariifolium TaxID=118510 RepID=A0A6L2MT25_TANCI|nr:transposase (putative), gypsy type [Tanacetum cinerariifolium]
MGAITDVKCVLTQKALDAFCNKFYIQNEVHPNLPNQNDTMHERLAKKIRLHTRFFDFANFRLPLSTFLVDVLRHFLINLSQLSVIEAAKVDDFACPASFLWHTAKHVTRDHASVEADFNAQDYATLVAHLSLSLSSRSFQKHSFDPDHAESELEASVERLFDDGGSGNQTEQRNSTGGEQDANFQPVVEGADTAVENVAPIQSRRQGKRKFVIVEVGGASHPPKKLRKDHGIPSGTSVGGKSWSALQRLLSGVVLNAEVGVATIPTLHFVTTFVSTTLEREGGDHTDCVADLNIRTINAPRRFIISSDSSRHSGTNVAEAEVDSLVRSFVPIMTTVTTITSTVDPTSVAKEKLVEPFPFGVGSSSSGGTDPTMSVLSDLTGSDFLVGAIRTGINLGADLQKVYFFAIVRRMEHDQLFTEFNVGAARQMSLSAEVRKGEIKNLKARLLLREAEAAEAIRLRAEASNFKAVENSLRDDTNALKECNVVLEKERNALDVKVTDLEASAMRKERELTDLNALEKFYPHLLTTISGRRWLLTHGMELAIVNCLNSLEYLSALEAAIGKAIEKGMQDRLFAEITHGKEGRVLTDVAAYNPSTEVNYISALQQLQNVTFSLLARLKSNKDASVETVMDILRLEGLVAEKLRLNELQPNADQLIVPIHRLPDQVVVGATALSLAFDVSSFCVRKIRENIANQGSALRDVFVPLAKPFFATVLTCTKGTSDTADATAALSTTFASASTIAPISVDDYEIIGVDDQEVADGDAASFPNVDDA